MISHKTIRSVKRQYGLMSKSIILDGAFAVIFVLPGTRLSSLSFSIGADQSLLTSKQIVDDWYSLIDTKVQSCWCARAVLPRVALSAPHMHSLCRKLSRLASQREPVDIGGQET